jgi:hypothetical protein
MKTATLTGVQLEYAVALAEGYKFGAPKRLANVHTYLFPLSAPGWKTLGAVCLYSDGWGDNVPKFSTGPAGDAIIDREHITTKWMGDIHRLEPSWIAHMPYASGQLTRTGTDGATRRIAAMRAFVESRLGPEIDIHEVIK